MYSIGQVSAMTNLPISTLRYYDKEGFFPNLEKQSGIRRFSQAELDAIRMIAIAATAHLRAGGWLLLEHGLNQGPAVRTLLRDAGFYGVKTVRDLESRDRVTLGQRT